MNYFDFHPEYRLMTKSTLPIPELYNFRIDTRDTPDGDVNVLAATYSGGDGEIAGFPAETILVVREVAA